MSYWSSGVIILASKCDGRIQDGVAVSQSSFLNRLCCTWSPVRPLYAPVRRKPQQPALIIVTVRFDGAARPFADIRTNAVTRSLNNRGELTARYLIYIISYCCIKTFLVNTGDTECSSSPWNNVVLERPARMGVRSEPCLPGDHCISYHGPPSQRPPSQRCRYFLFRVFRAMLCSLRVLLWCTMAQWAVRKPPSVILLYDLVSQGQQLTQVDHDLLETLGNMARRASLWEASVRDAFRAPADITSTPIDLITLRKLLDEAKHIPVLLSLEPKVVAALDDGGNRYCLCRGPNDGSFMVGCDTCEEWFHGACVKLKVSTTLLLASTRYQMRLPY